MIEVVSGIIRVGKNLNSGGNILLVHPWFFGDEKKKYALSSIGEPLLLGAKKSDNYLLNLERLLAFKWNIFIFEDEDRKSETTARILRTRRTAGRYIIPTEEADSLPATLHKQKCNETYDEYLIMMQKAEWYRVEWDHVASFLRRFPGEFYFAGGYSDPDCGCLSTTLEMLKERGIEGKFVRGCCFQRYPN